MRPNLPFLLATLNAILKPGGLLKWKMRLVKDARLSLPLTEVMKIARLTSPLLDVPRPSLPRPRLRHGRRLALLFHPNETLNLHTLFFALSLALIPLLPPPITFLTASLPGSRLRSTPLTRDLTFLSLSQRSCAAEPELPFRASPSHVHSSFCSPFSSAQFHAAASNPSSSTATGPDKVAYPMLNHLSRSGMDFLLHIFNLSWSSHSFPSICKTSSIIPIHNMRKPLDSPASFRPIFLTSCVSQLFERIILSRVLFFLESNSILSPRQTGFHPVRSTLDQILYLSQSISDGFNKPRPGSRTILSTIDFSKAFDSVWHPALFHLLISAGLSPCFARWTQSFLSDWHACMVYQNHKSRFFRVRQGVPQGSVLGPVLFSLFINDLPDCLPSSVSCSLYADDLAIWSSSLSVSTAVEASQEALLRLERWSEYWCFPLNPSKCDASFFSVDPHQANLQPNLLLLGSRLRFIPTPTFLGVTFDRTLSFSKHESSLKAKFFPRLTALRCISASSSGPLSPPFFCINIFFGSFSHMLHPDGFLS